MVVNEMIHLHSLNKIKEQIPNIEKKYENFYQDFNIIDTCIKENLPYNVIEFLISKHKGDLKSYNENIYPLYFLLLEKKYEIFDLFLRYGFNINGNIYIESMNKHFNLYFALIFNGELDEEKIKYLITHGIDINKQFPKIENNLGMLTVNSFIKYRMIDSLILNSFDSNNEKIYPYYESIRFLFNYYSTANNKPIISLIFFGKERKKISNDNFAILLKENIRYVDIDNIPKYGLIKIIQCNALNIIKLFISFLGVEAFKNSKFLSNLQQLIYYEGGNNFLNSINNIIKIYEDKYKESEDEKLIFEKIKEKNEKVVENILYKHKEIVNIRNENEKTPLIYAEQYAIDKPEIFDILIKYESNKDAFDKNKSTALHIACQYNNYNSISKLITETNINFMNKSNQTPLMVALKQNNFNCALVLLQSQYNINVNIADNNNDTPLIYMIKNNMEYLCIYKLLINKGAHINYNQFKNELINKIINNKSFLKSIINNGIYFSENDNIKYINYPLIFSIKENMLNLFKHLLNYYEVINEYDQNKKSCLFYAIENDNEEYFNLLINSEKINIKDCNDTSKTPLEYSLELNKENMTKLLLYKYIDFFEKDYKENSYLKDIINSKFSNIVLKLSNQNELNYSKIKDIIYLIKNQIEQENKNTNIDKVSNENQDLKNNRTNENYDMLELILDEYIEDINKQSGDMKLSPLMILIIKENYNGAKLIIEHDADVNIRDIYSNTPFMYMLKYSKINEEIYKLLINHGAFIDYKLFKKPHFIDTIIKNSVFIKLYINKEIKIKYEDKNESVLISEPLIFSVKLKHYHFIEQLLKNGINTDERDKDNNNPISTAEKNNDQKTIELLKKYKKSSNEKEIITEKNNIKEKNIKEINKKEKNVKETNEKDNSKKEINKKEINKKEINKKEINKKEINKKEINKKEINKKEINKKEINKKEINKKEINKKEINKKEINKKEINKKEINKKEKNVEETNKKEINKKEENIKENNENETNKKEKNVKEANENEANEKEVNKKENNLKEINIKETNEEVNNVNKDNTSINVEIHNVENLNNNNYEDEKYDIDISDESLYEYSILQISCIKGNIDMIEVLLSSQTEDINKTFSDYKLTSLMFLIISENYECAKLLLKFNPDVNIKDIYGNTPFIYMLKNLKINKEIYELLIDKGSYINNSLFNDNKFIHQLIKNEVFIELLINRSIKIDGSNNVIKTIRQPLIFAIKRNQYDLTKVLIDHNANINEFSYNGNTPLFQSVESNNYEVVKLLIENNVDLGKYNNEGKDILTVTKEKGNKDIISIIQKALNINDQPNFVMNNVNNPDNNNLNIGGQEIFNNYYNYGGQGIFNSYNYYNSYYIPFDFKNAKNHYSFLQNLIDEIKNCKESTALQQACIMDNIEDKNKFIRLHINDNAKININKQVGNYRLNALMILIYIEDYKNAIYLIKNGANVNMVDITNPLLFAIENNLVYLVETIIKYNVNMNEVDKNGNPPLIFALKLKNPTISTILIQNNVNIEARDRNGNTPLFLAITYHLVEVIKILLAFNVNLNKVNPKGKTALEYSFIHDIDIFHFLINNKYNKYNINNELFMAIKHNFVKYAILLIQNGADVNYENKNGLTPLLYSIISGKIKFVDLLISYGVKIDTCNSNGIYPIKYSIEIGEKEITRALIEQSPRYNSDNDYYKLIRQKIEDENDLLVDYAINNPKVTSTELLNKTNIINSRPLLSNISLFRAINVKHKQLNKEYIRCQEFLLNNKNNINNSFQEFGENYSNINNKDNFEISRSSSSSSINSIKQNIKENGSPRNISYDQESYESSHNNQEYNSNSNFNNSISIVFNKFNEFNDDINDNVNMDNINDLVKNYIDIDIDDSDNSDDFDDSDDFEDGINDFHALDNDEKSETTENEEKNITDLIFLFLENRNPFAKKLIQENNIINNENSEGINILTYLLLNPDKYDDKLFDYLYINSNKKYENGKTLLMYAAENEIINNKKNNDKSRIIIDLLISHHLDINEKDDNDETALFYAVKKKNQRTIIYLIKLGADVEIKNKKNENVLFPAVRTGNKLIIEFLLKKVKNKNLINIENKTILNYTNEKSIINLLFKYEVFGAYGVTNRIFHNPYY
ncbi:ankyrin [Neocallimastix lanati (nom. inval.)]|uniref:Ankyrin n=1 Tax=Neocallimastix californiae TaxID=1754190 RepID=A0A1Y2F786_9FUNG|nr:ankyrin [Neocallimastix sp. JGI-2020a]ORY78785.1 ankyrin [Neocallimastix californiae]|eukprot:ORY78785.1 ankyrin [Neocallimastix californiae]